MINFKGEERIVKIHGTFFKVAFAIAAISTLGRDVQLYNLNKDLQVKDISGIEETKNIEPSSYEIDFDKIEKSKYKRELSEFVSFLINKYPKEVLINFYNNINRLKIKRNYVLLLLSAGGGYDPEENILSLVRRKGIFHELFHMATCFFDEKTGFVRCGFYQYYIPSLFEKRPRKRIGFGLNEGYTQVMAFKYFGKTQRVAKSYKFETEVCNKLETIIGEDIMEKLFFKADLMGLIEELKKYAPEEDVMRFITYLDAICQHGYENKNKSIGSSVLFIYSFLTKIAKKKYQDELNSGKIDEDTYNRKLKLFINSLGEKTTIYIYRYDTIEKEKTVDKIKKKKV